LAAASRSLVASVTASLGLVAGLLGRGDLEAPLGPVPTSGAGATTAAKA